MKQTIRIIRQLLPALLLIAQCQLAAQIQLTDKIPVDPSVKIGKLENGLTYYIKENKKPEQKVELRLVVNAGSILEDDDQQGLAHMAEHMAFNGTKNFKKNDIINFLQKIGVGFGNDLNAYTSFDETVYMLPIPVDKPENLEKGFRVLEDWAHNVSYLDSDINSERNIILEESRLGKGAEDRMFRQIYPSLFAGSKYADRLPIGIDSIIRTFKPDAIRRFYHEWYRPDLMAVIVVGDVPVAKAEEMIIKHFSGLKNPSNQRARELSKVPPYQSNSAKMVTDKEATNYDVSVSYSAFPFLQATTVGGYKDDIIRNIFTSLLNTRLRELTQKENPPFLYAYGYFNSYARDYNQFNASAGVATADVAGKGLATLIEEIEKAKRFGFTAAELDRAKLNLMANMERAYNERDKTESARYVDEYIRNFLENESIPGVATELGYYKFLLPQITLDDVKNVSALLQKTPNFFISLTGPQAPVLPSAGSLVAVADSVTALKDIKPWEEKQISTTLLKKIPTKGKIIKETKDPLLGTKTWTLSNGTTVTIKKTDFKNDEIQMGARRFGGSSNYGIADKYNSAYALGVINAMGYGDFSPTDLQKIMAGKTASAGVSMSRTTDGYSGSSSVKDLETMLQLLHLKATSPRKDTTLFQAYVQKSKAQLAFALADQQTAFVDTLIKTVYHNDPAAPIAVPRPEYFDKINLKRAMEIYRERFGNAYGMHFVFVGSIDEATLRPLVEKYIGGLPSVKKNFTFKDNGLRPVKGKIDLNVYKGQAEKSMILMMMTGETPYSEDLALKAAAIAEVLNIRMNEELREKIQGIYSGHASVGLEKYPYPNYSVFVQLPTGPEKIDTLMKAMNAEFRQIKTMGPSAENLSKVKIQWTESRRTAMKQNGTWMGYLLSASIDKRNPDRFLHYEKYVNVLTPAELQAAAKLLLSGQNIVNAILMPEKR